MVFVLLGTHFFISSARDCPEDVFFVCFSVCWIRPIITWIAGGRMRRGTVVHPHWQQRFLLQKVSSSALVLSQSVQCGLNFDGTGSQHFLSFSVVMGMLYFLTTCVIFWRHKSQTEEDIAVCECQYDILDPESPCGDRCLNLLTNTECTPGYCRCGVYCKNQVGPCYFGIRAIVRNYLMPDELVL